MRVLVGGVGYRNLRDHSIGPAVTDRLAQHPIPGVACEDLSYNPLAVCWRLDDEAATTPFDRLVLVAGIARGTRLPGTITAYRWDRALPPPDEIQRAVAEAVTGIISVDNTLVILAHFGALPPAAIVVEVEPLVHDYGEAFSTPLAAAFDDLCTLVTTLSTTANVGSILPEAPLGGTARPAASVEG